MTSPRKITIECPRCREEYQDWHRPSVNLALEELGAESLDQETSSVCPTCSFRIRHGMLVVTEEEGVFIVQAAGD